MEQRHGASEWAMLLALTVTWGSAFLLTKIAVSGLPPDVVAAGRLVIASLILIPAATLIARRPKSSLRLWVFHLLMAIFGYALPFSLISWAQGSIDSGLSGILMAVMPLATLGFAHFLVPGERLTPYRVAGFLLGFAGVAVLMGPASWSGLAAGAQPLAPILAVLCSALSYAVSSILARLRPTSDALFTGAVTTSLAAVMIGPAALLGPVPALPGGKPLTALILLGIFSTALAAIVYFKLVKSAGPAFVAQLNYLIPLWAVGCGIFFLDEQPQPNQIYALGLILIGILVTHLERSRWRVRRRPTG